MENKLEKQDLIDMYNILFWVRAGDAEKANRILEENKMLAQKIYDQAQK